MKQMTIVNNANVHRVTKGSDMTEQLNNNSRLEEIRIMFLYFLSMFVFINRLGIEDRD